MVENQMEEVIPTRTVTGWRMCTDFRKLNSATRKDHFPLPFIDQILERLAGHKYFCYLDGYSGFLQIPIHPKDQDKTPLLAHMAHLPTEEYHLDCVMHQELSRDV